MIGTRWPVQEELEATVEQIETLLDRMRLSSLRAIACAEVEDLPTLDLALQERGELFVLLQRAMGSLRPAAGGLAPPDLQDSRSTDRVLNALDVVSACDRQLFQVLDELRAAAARNLDQLALRTERDGTGYGAATLPVGRHLDLTR